MADYLRGKVDAKLFTLVYEHRGGWVGRRPNGNVAWLVNEVTDRYLEGLAAGGCQVQTAIPPRLAA